MRSSASISAWNASTGPVTLLLGHPPQSRRGVTVSPRDRPLGVTSGSGPAGRAAGPVAGPQVFPAAARREAPGDGHPADDRVRRAELPARHPLHLRPDHRRRRRRLAGRAGPLPAGRQPGLPVGEPGDHRPAAARPRGRAVDGRRRADARRAELDLRPRPRRARPGARHRAAAGGVRKRGPGLRARHHRAGHRRRPDRPGGHERLRPDHPRPVDRVDGATTATARRTCTPSTCATRSTR